jgi:hypothetical protein
VWACDASRRMAERLRLSKRIRMRPCHDGPACAFARSSCGGAGGSDKAHVNLHWSNTTDLAQRNCIRRTSGAVSGHG